MNYTTLYRGNFFVLLRIISSAILTQSVIDFLLVLWNGPLFLTKKVKLSRSALWFNAAIFWMNIPARVPSMHFLSLSFLPCWSSQRGGSFGARFYFRHWHPLLSAYFAFPPVVFSSKYRTSRYSVVEAIKGKGPGQEVRVDGVNTNVWTQPEADHRKHLLVINRARLLPRLVNFSTMNPPMYIVWYIRCPNLLILISIYFNDGISFSKNFSS